MIEKISPILANVWPTNLNGPGRFHQDDKTVMPSRMQIPATKWNPPSLLTGTDNLSQSERYRLAQKTEVLQLLNSAEEIYWLCMAGSMKPESALTALKTLQSEISSRLIERQEVEVEPDRFETASVFDKEFREKVSAQIEMRIHLVTKMKAEDQSQDSLRILKVKMTEARQTLANAQTFCEADHTDNAKFSYVSQRYAEFRLQKSLLEPMLDTSDPHLTDGVPQDWVNLAAKDLEAWDQAFQTLAKNYY